MVVIIVTTVLREVAILYTNNLALACVGGYVGAVVNGGLIFRNMTSQDIAFKSGFVAGSSNYESS